MFKKNLEFTILFYYSLINTTSNFSLQGKFFCLTYKSYLHNPEILTQIIKVKLIHLWVTFT